MVYNSLSEKNNHIDSSHFEFYTAIDNSESLSPSST